MQVTGTGLDASAWAGVGGTRYLGYPSHPPAGIAAGDRPANGVGGGSPVAGRMSTSKVRSLAPTLEAWTRREAEAPPGTDTARPARGAEAPAGTDTVGDVGATVMSGGRMPSPASASVYSGVPASLLENRSV